MEKSAELIARGLSEALRLLRENAAPEGLLASSPTSRAVERGYARVFGRDAGICAIAQAHCGAEDLQASARSSLYTLAAHQAPNGQIPKYVDVQRGTADFWYLGCIDATLWWLIAVKVLAQRLSDLRMERDLASPIEKALDWLHCQEHQQIFLLQQNEASDWADIMPRSGFVLYTNALWYYVKVLYGLKRTQETRRHFNDLFFPFGSRLPEYRRLRLLTHYVRNKARNRELYLSFVNLSFWGEEGDVFGNLLAILFGLADGHRAERILRAIAGAQKDAAYPVRATCTPIARNDTLWRAYMGRHRQNLEFQYHNGGIWPLVGGFWVMALLRAGKRRKAQEELLRLARANALNGWEFNEWLHGKTGEPCGMPRQSWNAAMFLLAHHAFRARVF
ncbi:MAG: glycoside hydrolase [Betaproteobacteria bacterium]|nr:glycoside hydrolase [Betaproteobacteria bacterium]